MVDKDERAMRMGRERMRRRGYKGEETGGWEVRGEEDVYHMYA